MNDRVKRGDGENKKIAFLMDAKTIAVMDFVASSVSCVVNHDAKIDWFVSYSFFWLLQVRFIA
jgi:intraflagellar transport protein 172